jgi:hypothetical protein
VYLKASDGWSKKLDFGDCISERYYFEKIVSGYDGDSAVPPEFEIGTEDARERVDPMFAFFSFQSRYCEAPQASDMTESDGIRFCLGQQAITESVSVGYGKNIVSVTFILKDGAAYTPAGYTSAPAPEERDDAGQPPPGEKEEYENAGLAAEELTITVGYFGGTYYTKKVFSLSELQSMETVRQVYSSVDNMPAPCLNSCVGVRLTDILAAAGIDAGSVATFNFYCADVANTWYVSLTREYLLDTVRFYYPHLAECWNYDDLEPLPGASLDAVPIDTMIAYEDNWRRYGLEPDFENLTAETRFRLAFGQTDVSTPTSSRAAKWIHTIAVTLIGTPPSGITLDASALELEVGSVYQLAASLEGVGMTTDQRIVWSSSNEDAVSVSASGRITVRTGETAVITATTVVGGLSASVVINGGEAAPVQSAETAAQPPPSPEPAPDSEAPPSEQAYETAQAGEETGTGSGTSDGEVYEIADSGAKLSRRKPTTPLYITAKSISFRIPPLSLRISNRKIL